MDRARFERSLSRLCKGLAKPRSPLPLALLRIAVALIILVSSEPSITERMARSPSELWLPPVGMQWFVPIFEQLSPHVVLFRRVLEASALLTLLGLWTRVSVGVLGVSFVLLFGGAQLTGTVLHDMHLFWMLALLFVSPAGQVLSLDAWAKGAPFVFGQASSAAALATLFARLLLGVIYFFPGFHKLLTSGWAWASSDNLQNQLRLKWFQAGGELPWPRPDLWRAGLVLAGVAVLIFELSFVGWVLFRRGRWVAGAAGLSFHGLTQHFMYIPFPSLWACYVVLWDGERRSVVTPSTGAQAGLPTRSAARLQSASVVVVGSCLLLGALVQGVRGDTQAWPFACYPSFAALAPDVIVDLAVHVQFNDGGRHVLRNGPLPPSAKQARPAHAWSTVWRLAGLYGDPVSPIKLRAFAGELAQRENPPLLLARPYTLSVYAETYSIAPESYGSEPLRRRLIHEETLPAGSPSGPDSSQNP